MALDKKELAHFLIAEGVLLFGEFTLKSGRQSPHFFNSGRFDSGRALNCLGKYYAQKIKELGSTDIIFGPAYKGIPLAVTVANAYDRLFDTETGVLFDRKEVKDHGDGGLFVGRTPEATSQLILVDDVISSGISLQDSIQLIKKSFNITPAFSLVAVDRQEKGRKSDLSAAREVEQEEGVPLHSLIKLDEVVALMEGEEVNGKVVIDANQKQKVLNYLENYGGN